MTEDVKTIIEKDLADFGLEGILEMRAPNRRKKNDLKNAMGRHASVRQEGEGKVIDGADMGDLEICSIMACVYKAPFTISLKGYLEYADMLSRYGKDAEEEQLYEFMLEKSVELQKDSPFVDSQSAETVNSE